MERHRSANLLLLVLLFSFFAALGIPFVYQRSLRIPEPERMITADVFRTQRFSEALLEQMQKGGDPSRITAIYLLEKNFHSQWADALKKGGSGWNELYEKRLKWWSTQENWNAYLKYCSAIWKDLKYFPIPASADPAEETVSFTDSWMVERTFGGRRGHEGTDLMTAKDIPGYYPVVSMTDGTVVQMGWLPKGGYRIGILAPGGGYFYYAHLDSYADIEAGDTIKAGDLLGFAGNTGYGPEGTKGKFATHLHIGIYLYPNGQETSINPYWILKYLEQTKLTYTYPRKL